MTKPIAIILSTISILKMMRKAKSKASISGSGSSLLGSSIARLIQFAKIVNNMNLSNQELNTICITKLLNRLVVVQPQSDVLAKFLV